MTNPDHPPTADLPVQAWVGCYTDLDADQGLVSLALGASGLTRTGSARLRSPSWITPLDPAAGTWLAQTEAADSALSVVDLSGGHPVVRSTVATGGRDGCHVALSPQGRWIAVAHYTSGSVALLAAPTESGLAPPVDLLAFSGHSAAVPDRQEAPHAHQVVWLDENTMLVPDLGADRIRTLRVSDEAGTSPSLIEGPGLDLPAGTGPRHLVLRQPQGSDGVGTTDVDLAVVTELSGQVFSFRRRGGDWTGVDASPSSRGTGAQPSGFRLFPDTRTLVVANRTVNTLSLLDWGPTGELALSDEFDCAGKHPRDVVLHHESLWVALQHSNAVAVFEHTNGRWQHLDSVAVRTPACIVFPQQATRQ